MTSNYKYIYIRNHITETGAKVIADILDTHRLFLFFVKNHARPAATHEARVKNCEEFRLDNPIVVFVRDNSRVVVKMNYSETESNIFYSINITEIIENVEYKRSTRFLRSLLHYNADPKLPSLQEKLDVKGSHIRIVFVLITEQAVFRIKHHEALKKNQYRIYQGKKYIMSHSNFGDALQYIIKQQNTKMFYTKRGVNSLKGEFPEEI